MWDLEYLLLFGLPENKLELLDGITPLGFPFVNRDSAEAHFDLWIEQIAQWKRVPSPVTRVSMEDHIVANIGGPKLQLFRRPIRLELPMKHEAWDWLKSGFWRRELWEGQPIGFEKGWENSQRHWEAKSQLWGSVRKASEGKEATYCGGVDLMLSETTAVAPDFCYYDKPCGDWMIGGDFYSGPPDFVAEILSASTRVIDRGIRRDLYARAGVRELWLLDPEIQVVEIHKLCGRSYAIAATFRAGETFKSDVFGEFVFAVNDLFKSQWPREEDRKSKPNPIPQWFMPPDMRLGLEYLLLFGHAERRHEIWENQAPCILAFGSEEEAQLRFGHFLKDICQWEGVPLVASTRIETGLEVATVGRFQIVRRGQHVRLNVAVDGRKFRAMLENCAKREAWDWGEKDVQVK